MTGLTREALLERRRGIGGSDAGKLMAGEWHALWLDKTGRVEPEDLSGNFAVQLGIVTEKLNLDWAEKKLGNIGARGSVCVSKEYPMLRCTLDGLALREGITFDRAIKYERSDMAVVQAKHVNGFSKIEDILERYFWQVTHEMIVTGCPVAWLSVIIGTNEPVLERVDYEDFAAAEYIDRAREFWGYVERNEEPELGRPVISPPAPPAKRVVDMAGNNRWAMLADDWIKNEQPAKLFDASVKGLKALIEADVAEAHGYGVMVKRDKRGLSIRRSGE